MPDDRLLRPGVLAAAQRVAGSMEGRNGIVLGIKERKHFQRKYLQWLVGMG